MKPTAFRILLLLNAALAALLALVWFDKDASLRNVHWTPPQPLPPPIKGLVPDLPAVGGTGDVRAFLETLERPLFTATRRPPPPPAPVKPPPPPPPPDPLAELRLFGIFGAGESGGIIALRDGKNTIIRVRDSIGPWVVKRIDDRSVTLTQGAETRVLRLTPLTALPPSDTPSPPAPRGRARRP